MHVMPQVGEFGYGKRAGIDATLHRITMPSNHLLCFQTALELQVGEFGGDNRAGIDATPHCITVPSNHPQCA